MAGGSYREVARLWVVSDDRRRGLLRHQLIGRGQIYPDQFGRGEQTEDAGMIGQIRAGRIAPGVALALGGAQTKFAANVPMGIFGQGLRCLYAESVREKAAGIIARLLQPIEYARWPRRLP